MPKCRVFAIDDSLKEIVPGGLYGKHLFGETISVAVVKFLAEKGGNLPAKPHSHGEEASLQLVGGCSVLEGTQTVPGNPESVMRAGAALIIPAGCMHYGTNTFEAEGVSMRLNVVTPARKEYGPEDSVPYYPLKSRGAAA